MTADLAVLSDRRAVVVRMSDVVEERVEWLWQPYVARKKLTILQGDPGVGKTFAALSVAASVSRGNPLPGRDGQLTERQPPQSILYLTGEDGLGDTIRPRLAAMGADLGRVFVLDGWESDEDQGVVDAQDLSVIEEAVESVRPALVVMDPIQAFLGAKVDMYRANETRPVLSGLARLAAKHGFAVILVGHLRKSSSDRAVHRGLGSIDFAAAARSILLVAPDPDDPARRVMAHVKSSLAESGTSLAYEIIDGGVVWMGTSEHSPEHLLDVSRTDDRGRPRSNAAAFLRAELAAGPRPSKAVKEGAFAQGITEATLRRAKEELGVQSQRKHHGGGRRGSGEWLWALPDTRREYLDQLKGSEDISTTYPDDQDAQLPPLDFQGDHQEQGTHE